MPVVQLAPHELSDLRLLAWGAYAPLTGFLREADYLEVVGSMRLASGKLWSLPITIAADAATAGLLGGASEIELVSPEGSVVATLRDPDVYRVDPMREVEQVYGTSDRAHPGVARVLAGGPWRVGGRIAIGGAALELQAPFNRYPASPVQVKAAMAERGWDTVVAFQTRNPIHRAHEYLTKIALEAVDGLLIHPLVGETKADDVPATVRLRCYETLLERYYPADRTLLALFPAPMRYAGPREAVFHALVRANYGATHLIVGRDHAGVGNFYGTYAAQDLLRRIGANELGLTPIFFDNAFYCRACSQMATGKTCPHGPALRVDLSGTLVRALLSRGEPLPIEFSRPEIAALLLDAYREQQEQLEYPAAEVSAG